MSGEEAPTPPQQQPEQEKMPDEEPPPADSETPQETGSSSNSPSSSSSSSPASGEEEKPVTCRALVLSGYGGYDKVKLLQVKPLKTKQQQLEAGEVIVNIKACGLNFADLMGKQGLYELLPAPPVIMGMEGSGVIQAVGEDVKDRKVGDRVIVLSRSGMWQEVVVMPANRTFPMPKQMSFEEGAAIPVNYLTAYMMLFDIANVRPGKSVLIHMAAGGVGTAVTQLCRTVPDVTVFGTASPSKHETIAQGGVTHPIDYRTKDYVEEIRKISPKGVDIVLDPLGGSDTQKGYSLLKPMGTLVSFGVANCVTGQKKNLLAMAKTWAYQFSLTMLKLMQANKAVGGFHLGYITDEQLIGRTMSKLLELYEQGKIKPRIDSCYHFEEVTDAMKRMHERLNIGKVILLTEAKKVEEKPKSEPEKSESEPEPVQNVEEPEDATNEEEEEETEEEEPTEEVKAED